jgi:glycosyltransferase involved in cell wall biosynthesis
LDRALVSVIIPAFNASAKIRDSMKSVLAQTYQEIEVIIVDDGSSDATSAIVEEFIETDARFRLILQRNAGVGAARNTAVLKARGRYIAPLDADDFWFPDKLEKQVARIEQCGEETGLVYCWSILIDEHGDFAGQQYPHTVEGCLRRVLVMRNIVGNGSVPLFRTTAFRRVGLYPTRAEQRGAQGCEDWDVYLRMAEHFAIRVVPEYLVAYRQSDDSMSVNAENMAASFAILMRRARERNVDLPPSIFRWSAGFFYAYLARNSFDRCCYRSCLRFLKEAVCADPALLLSSGVSKTFIRTLLRLITDSRREHFAGEIPPLPSEKGRKQTDLVSNKKKEPFIFNRIFEKIERRRWSAALDDGA